MSEKSKSSQRLSCKRRESSDDDIYGPTQDLNTASTTTPIRVSNLPVDEESPHFLCSTQELQDEVDVLWKWNSPQMKQFMSNNKRPKKRLLMQTSPKIPLRRHPSSDAQTKKDFAKLREELNSLKEELNRPNDEDSLVLSPREEKHIKDEVKLLETNVIDEMMDQNLEQHWDMESDDPFNDDMEAFMIQCSQQVEAMLSKTDKVGSDVGKVLFLDNGLTNTGRTTTGSNSNFQTSSSTSSNRQNLGSSDYSTNNKLLSENNTNSLTSNPRNNLPIKSIATNLQQSTSETTNRLPSLSDNNGSKNKFRFKKTTSPTKCISDLNTEWNPTQELVHRLMSEKVINIDKNMECSSKIPESKTNTNQNTNDSIFDDSFDMVLSQMADDDLDQLTQVADIKTFIHTTSSNILTKEKKGYSNNLLSSLTNSPSLVEYKTAKSSSISLNGTCSSKEQSNRTTTITSAQIRITCTNAVQTSTNSVQSCKVIRSQRNSSTNQKSNIFPRCNSDGELGVAKGQVQTVSGKMEFHRTKSFEISNDSMLKSDKSKTTDHLRSNLQTLSEFTDSPIKCSPEEIEKKRLAAVAIREAKKQREIIEKNRQEALKKLEERRKRNVDTVKSSLVKRL